MEPTSSDPIRVFDQAAAFYQAKYMDVSCYAVSLDLFCSALEQPNAEVLEIACGPGNITKYLLEKRLDLRILGTDASPNMLELAKAANPGATFQLLDARDVGTLSMKYDGLVCGFVLPYLTPQETLKLIHDAAGLLRKGGVFYLSTLEGDPARSGPQLPSSGKGEAVHVQYYRAGFLTDALRAEGFTIWATSHYMYTAANGSPSTDVVIVALR